MFDLPGSGAVVELREQDAMNESDLAQRPQKLVNAVNKALRDAAD